jgi:undecaprenyl-diphosphatase
MYLWVNRHVVGVHPALDALIGLLVNEYFVPVGLSLGLLFLWFGGRGALERDRWQGAVTAAALAVALANICIKLLNLVYYRDRPFKSLPAELLFYEPTDSSFPSNAVAVGAAIATAVWLRERRFGSLFWALALLLAPARLGAGVHYPSDILGGALFGILAAVVADRAVRLLWPWLSRFVGALRALGVA